jgi:hypothetical protein
MCLLILHHAKRMHFLLILSVTKVICERTFSNLIPIKTRLRCKLNEENLESLLLISVKKELLEVVNYLIESSTIMHQMFNI